MSQRQNNAGSEEKERGELPERRITHTHTVTKAVDTIPGVIDLSADATRHQVRRGQR